MVYFISGVNTIQDSKREQLETIFKEKITAELVKKGIPKEEISVSLKEIQRKSKGDNYLALKIAYPNEQGNFTTSIEDSDIPNNGGWDGTNVIIDEPVYFTGKIKVSHELSGEGLESITTTISFNLGDAKTVAEILNDCFLSEENQIGINAIKAIDRKVREYVRPLSR